MYSLSFNTKFNPAPDMKDASIFAQSEDCGTLTDYLQEEFSEVEISEEMSSNFIDNVRSQIDEKIKKLNGVAF